MALEGSLKEFGLADILQLICFQRKTGVLTLEGGLDRVKLFFIEGNIVSAESKRRMEDNRLGKILVKKGVIKEEQLRSALSTQKTSGTKLGKILIEQNLVEKDVIYDILRNQVNETVIQVFNWNRGTYSFTTQGVPQDKEFAFTIDTQHLLMEGLRIVDEWSVVKGKLTLDTVFEKKKDQTAQLSDTEKEVFSYVDGENDVSTIVDLCSQDSSQVSNTLLTLMEKGLIAAVETVTPAEEEPAHAEKELSPMVARLPLATVVISIAITLVLSFFLAGDDLSLFRAGSHIKLLRFQIDSYRLTKGSYPATLDEISRAKDPWGNDYAYSVWDDAYSVASNGPDGKEGTADDIH